MFIDVAFVVFVTLSKLTFVVLVTLRDPLIHVSCATPSPPDTIKDPFEFVVEFVVFIIETIPVHTVAPVIFKIPPIHVSLDIPIPPLTVTDPVFEFVELVVFVILIGPELVKPINVPTVVI